MPSARQGSAKLEIMWPYIRLTRQGGRELAELGHPLRTHQTPAPMPAALFMTQRHESWWSDISAMVSTFLVALHRLLINELTRITRISSIDVMAWAGAAAVRLCGRQDRHVRNFTLRGGSVV